MAMDKAKTNMNVIWIMTDQQMVNAMGCVDDSFHTPRLDELVSKGVRFTSQICTSAQCSPSRATWMTGRYPHQVAVNQIGHILDPQEPNIAREFAEAAYETVYFGKWHLGRIPLSEYGFQVTDYRTDGVDLRFANTSDPKFFSYKDALTTAKVVNYLDDYEQKTPFFMTVSWFMPHPNTPEDFPFEDIKEFTKQFPLEEMPLPASFYQDDLASKPSFQFERSKSDEVNLTIDKVKRDAQKYRSMLSLMDHYLGYILDKLAEKQLDQNTVILFTSDHGDMQGAHRQRLKGVLPYKELYNTPLIVYVPGGNVLRPVIHELVSSAAVPGTLLDAVGLPVPSIFEGGTLMPLLRAKDSFKEHKVFFEHYKAYWGHHPFRAIQTTQWKYIYYYEENIEEMYDLENDPEELVNVANNVNLTKTKTALKQEVDTWWVNTGGLSKEPRIDDTSNWGKS